MYLRVLIIILLLFPATLIAQKKNFLQKIAPDHAVLQYAGEIGFISAGAGYTTKNKKINTEFLYGYVPESAGGITIHSITGKFTWLPLKYIYQGFTINYITTGVFINYTIGQEYFTFSPSYYPYNYYGFPSAIEEGLFLGGSVSKRKVSLYYELGTTGRGLLSYFGNTKSLSLTDIVNFGVGTRVSFK